MNNKYIFNRKLKVLLKKHVMIHDEKNILYIEIIILVFSYENNEKNNFKYLLINLKLNK